MIKAAVVSAAAVSVVGAAILLSCDFGRFSTHMVLHIATMNVVAPLLAAWANARYPTRENPASWLWMVALIQIVLLWTWHSPAVHSAMIQSRALGLTLHGALLIAALLFWYTLLTISPAARWHTIPALLVTGKLACLLAALLIFAPSALYESGVHHGHAAEQFSALRALEDQQFAGLLMITACPLSYLIAAVVIAIRLISRPQIPAAILMRANPPAGS